MGFLDAFEDPRNREIWYAGIKDMTAGAAGQRSNYVGDLLKERRALEYREEQDRIRQEQWAIENARAQEAHQMQLQVDAAGLNENDFGKTMGERLRNELMALAQKRATQGLTPQEDYRFKVLQAEAGRGTVQTDAMGNMFRAPGYSIPPFPGAPQGGGGGGGGPMPPQVGAPARVGVGPGGQPMVMPKPGAAGVPSIEDRAEQRQQSPVITRDTAFGGGPGGGTTVTAKGAEEARANYARTLSSLDHIQSLRDRAAAGEFHFGPLSEGVSEYGGKISGGMDTVADLTEGVAEYFGVPQVTRNLKRGAKTIGTKAAEHNPAIWKSEALKVTRDLQPVWTTETRLTDADFKRILDASGLLNADSEPHFQTSLDALEMLVRKVSAAMAERERNALAGMPVPPKEEMLDILGIPKISSGRDWDSLGVPNPNTDKRFRVER